MIQVHEIQEHGSYVVIEISASFHGLLACCFEEIISRKLK